MATPIIPNPPTQYHVETVNNGRARPRRLSQNHNKEGIGTWIRNPAKVYQPLSYLGGIQPISTKVHQSESYFCSILRFAAILAQPLSYFCSFPRFPVDLTQPLSYLCGIQEAGSRGWVRIRGFAKAAAIIGRPPP